MKQLGILVILPGEIEDSGLTKSVYGKISLFLAS